jgi:hypothetical protein
MLQALSPRQQVAGVLSLVLLTSMAATVHPTSAQAIAEGPRPCAEEAELETEALAMAARCNSDVRVNELTLQTTQAWATSAGTVRAELSAGPVRVRQGDKWVPVDLMLETRADGSVAPKAHPENLVISGARRTAGNYELAAFGEGERRVTMAWSGTLPAPDLKDNTATYRDVKLGIDLVVKATADGVESFYIVKNRAAAAHVAEIDVALTGTDVASYRTNAAGSTSLLTANGDAVAYSTTPLMWDARTDADGKPAKVKKVKTRATARKKAKAKPTSAIEGAGVTLTLEAGTEIFDDPSTVYPVTIDPTLNPVRVAGDTYIREGENVDHSAEDKLLIGYQTGRTRSLIRWVMDGLSDKQIINATTYFWNSSSPNCTAQRWNVWSTEYANDQTVTWDTQPAWLAQENYSTGTAGATGCTAGYVSIPTTSFFRRAALNEQTRAYMGLQAHNELDPAFRKTFRSRDSVSTTTPYSVVEYNSYPTMSNLTTNPATFSGTATPRPVINTTTPAFSVRVADTEGSTVRPEFEWATAAGVRVGGTTIATAQASGSTFTTTVPTGQLANGQTYKWRVRSGDNLGWTSWSDWSEFQVDTTAPRVTSTAFPLGATVGEAKPGTFSVTPAAGTTVTAYLFGLNNPNPTTQVTAAAGGAATLISVTPSSAGRQVFYVRAKNSAGALSAPVPYQFSVASAVAPVNTTEQENAESAADTPIPPDATASIEGPITVQGCVDAGTHYRLYGYKKVHKGIGFVFKNGPGGNVTASRQTSLAVSMKVSMNASFSAGAILAKAETQFGIEVQATATFAETQQYSRNIPDNKYGSIQWGNWGQAMGVEKYVLNSSCRTTSRVYGTVNFMPSVWTWGYKYTETNS